MALGLAIVLAFWALPFFNRLADTEIKTSLYFTPKLFIVLIGFALFLGGLAGLYPAFYLSGVRLVKNFKRGNAREGGLFSLRKTLVVFQFSLSIILIVAMMVSWQQLHFMENQVLGFDKEQVLAIPLRTQKQSFAAQGLIRE